MNNKKGHLPVFGIGPALCYPMALLSAGDFPLNSENRVVIKIFLENDF